MVDLPPIDPGIEFVVASRGMSKGIAQTKGPQVIARPFIQSGLVQVGFQWKNLTSSVADGESSLFVILTPKLKEFQVSLGVAYKSMTGVREATDEHSWEFTGSVTRKVGKLGLRLAAVYSPNDLGGARQSLFLEGGPSFDLTKTARLSANIGHRGRVNGDDYTAFNAGIAKALFNGVTLDARYYDTNRGELGFPYKARVVISVRMAL